MNKKDIKQIEIENNRLITKLNKDNYRAYDNISIYLDLDDEIDLSKKIIKNDIVKMIYEGQERGQSWDEIIGEDYKKFADEVMSTRKNIDKKARFLYMLKGVFMIITLVFIINSLPIIFGKYDFVKLGVEVPIYMIAILAVGVVSIAILSFYNVTKGKKDPKYAFLSSFLMILAMDIASFIFEDSFYMNYKLYFLLFSISVILFIAVSIIYSKEKMNLIN